MSDAGSACVVTVHGIGFQRPPEGDQPGYADALHAHLQAATGDRLGDDPERPAAGPVYVQSEWQGSRAGGLARLDQSRPLAAAGKIAHVALVYSPSEPLEPRPGSVVETLGRAVLSHDDYIGALGALRLALGDAWSALHAKQPVQDHSTLRPRDDLAPPEHHNRVARLLLGHRVKAAPKTPGPSGIVRALEVDVATYVTRNDLRERVRGFVQEAMLELLGRTDVSSVFINSHSQGTLVCWDVLCRLPLFAWTRASDPRAGKLRRFVTAGSPIRKYVDMFTWGEQVGQLGALVDGDERDFWHNFYDVHDPVADPLDPATAWRPGQPLDQRPAGDIGLLVAVDRVDGARSHVRIADTRVDNIANSSGGGLQAHDY
jgi:hypothetical protein